MSLLLAGNFDAEEQAQWLAALREALPGERWVTWRPGLDAALAAEVDVAVVANPPPGSLQGLPRLGFIQSLWAGVDRLLRDETLPPGVPLARMVDPAMSAAMAETALWAVLSLHRGFFDYAAQQCARQWRQLPQRRADEVAVAVLGLGEMGGAAAARLAAQGYRVRGWSRSPHALPGIECTHGEAALPGVLGAADIVVNLLPLTPATTGLFDAARFAQMRRGAAFVNLARGAHVIEPDLLAALGDAAAPGRLHRAVLDVFAQEPLPAHHPFWRHPRVTLLPHAAALTDARSAARVAAENVRAWRAGRPVANLVARERGY
ncbi:2-hydroxyacid dehydrogenase [Caldimonas tepidiphila]|uniref:2-hydroxyacid dehydrogenase n=1 Tax=Caldimonas tepidiphila TaxID=2315841 RepID=UPI000E5BF15F|nr:glyoxylate/hydroxypyruvate reductase A [Caldimonas tepidiphila]